MYLFMTTVSEVEAELLIIGHVFESKAMKVVLYQPFGNISGETLALFFCYDWSYDYS